MIVQIVGYVCLLVVWSFVRIRSMLSMHKSKEAAVFGVIIGVSSITGSLLIARVDIPSMVVPFKIIFEPIGRMLLKQ
ncbi:MULTISPECIES: hypothetical protein [unclassified Paenibacillus]|uniref:hypothetical protein n=1 Tax=unclassified Paenibacillus TaxID=185978 RepID=UPI000708F191|nr:MULTISPECIES: hypothetical protein [unclassified Paenibacillus]KQX68132.1 hypothetical protein ASD40_24935 [Paenibacillus sp. Root444D2]KRE46513.1 hypothetical protein ASG85_29375 [Paenibacillus sp. Soil724D2]